MRIVAFTRAMECECGKAVSVHYDNDGTVKFSILGVMAASIRLTRGEWSKLIAPPRISRQTPEFDDVSASH